MRMQALPARRAIRLMRLLWIVALAVPLFGGGALAQAQEVVPPEPCLEPCNPCNVPPCPVPVTVAGQITTPAGTGLAGVTVRLAGAPGGDRLATTTADGRYSFRFFIREPEFYQYTVTPTKPGYRFAPPAQEVDGYGGTGIDFLAITQAAPADVDGDGRSDVAVFSPATGSWSAILSANNQYWSTQLSGEQAAPGDYDGDGRLDPAVFTPRTGLWRIMPSSSGLIRDVQWGQADDQPVARDYDGDGKADVAVFRPANGTWYVMSSLSGSTYAEHWGLAGDKPTPADFDGDGRADLAIFRPDASTGLGTFYVLRSSTRAWAVTQWGLHDDRPVVGDYDGDGLADLAVFRPGEGAWYILPSSGAAWYAVQWGLATDQLAPGEYDGDGITDVAVFRPSTGRWYIRSSSVPGTFREVAFGGPNDQALENAYLPR